MANDFKEAIVEIKLAYNIVDYIGASGVQLKQTGNKYKGLCPFHNEKTPSFTVDEHFQNYRCFGCGAHGDLISFVSANESLDFFEAVKKLAEDKGIELNFGEQKKDGVDYKSLRECLRETANFYVKEFRKLDPSHPARKEITKRGISEKKMMYGYAPEKRKALYTHLKTLNFDETTMQQAGVISVFTSDSGQESYADFWNGRLMFIITDITGKPIGFSGRKLYETDKRGKYVNSPDGPLFDKSSALYNIAKAKKMASDEKKVFVLEGQFDVAALVEADQLNSVASSGTAFTEKQGMILRRLVTESGKIIFCFDPDAAGIAAAVKVFKNIPLLHSQAEIVLLPEGYDPSDYREKYGNEKLVEALNNSISIVEFVLNQESAAVNMDDNVESMKYVQAAARILRTVSNRILREQYAKQVALESFVGIEEIKKAILAAEPLTQENRKPQEEKEEEVRPYETDEESRSSNEVLFERIEESENYMLAARLVSMVLHRRSFFGYLKRIHSVIPEDFYELLKEFNSLEEGVPVIAEHFTNVDLAEKLITNDFFPFQHLMDEEAYEKHFVYLATRLKTKKEKDFERFVRRETMKKLGGDQSASAEFLSRALSFEEKKMAKIAKSAGES